MLLFCAITSPYLTVTSPQFSRREKSLLPTVRAQLEPWPPGADLIPYWTQDIFLVLTYTGSFIQPAAEANNMVMLICSMFLTTRDEKNTETR